MCAECHVCVHDPLCRWGREDVSVSIHAGVCFCLCVCHGVYVCIHTCVQTHLCAMECVCIHTCVHWSVRALEYVCMCMCVQCGDRPIATSLLRVVLGYSDLTVKVNTDMPGFPGLPLVTNNDEFYVHFLSNSVINSCPHSHLEKQVTTRFMSQSSGILQSSRPRPPLVCPSPVGYHVL